MWSSLSGLRPFAAQQPGDRRFAALRPDYLLLIAAIGRHGLGPHRRCQNAALDQQPDLGAIQDFAFEQGFCDPRQTVLAFFDDLARAVVTRIHQLANLLVDQDGRGFTVIAMLGDLAAQEDLDRKSVV